MKTSQHPEERKLALRLGQADQQVDLLVGRVRDAADQVNGRAARQVDALRAREARVHARLREMREADEATWAEHAAELGHELDELEAQLTMTDKRLDGERATDQAAFAAAVDAELAAWGAYLESVKVRHVSREPRESKRWEAAVHALETRLARARAAVRSGQDVPTMRRCLAALDGAADEVALIRGQVP